MHPSCTALTITLFCLGMALPFPALAQTQNARILPSYKECQKLSSKKISADERAALTQRFKTNGMYCAMLTPPITVQNIFNAGQTKAQLRIVMGKNNRYSVDTKSLYAVLVPDHTNLPLTQLLALAGQVFALAGDMFNANVNAHSVKHVGTTVGLLAGMAGNNARSALVQLETLRIQAQLKEDDMDTSFWLERLSKLQPVAVNNAQAGAMQGGVQGGMPTGLPPFMGKAFEGMKGLLGTFTSEQ